MLRRGFVFVGALAGALWLGWTGLSGTRGVDAVSGATGGRGELPAEPDCIVGWARVAHPSFGFSACVPTGTKPQLHGSEWTFDADEGHSIVFSTQLKALTVEDVLSSLENFLKQKHLPATPVRGKFYKWAEKGGRGTGWWQAWPSIRNRFGLLVYAHCTGKQDVCDAHFANVETAARSVRWDDDPGTFPYPQWASLQKPPLILYALPGSSAAADLEWLAVVYRTAYEAISNVTGSDESPGVSVYFYPNKSELYRYTRRDSGFAMAAAGEVHSLFASREDRQSSGHELTHVITQAVWGDAGNVLLGEGIAVALDGNGADRVARAVKAMAGKPIAPSSLLGEAWQKCEPELAYALSGAFVEWLIKNVGVEKTRMFYLSVDPVGDSPKLVGRPFDELEKLFGTSLEGK